MALALQREPEAMHDGGVADIVSGADRLSPSNAVMASRRVCSVI
jgi:hypothetical protein